MDALSHSIVRMNLDAEVAMGVDELDEQGQLPVVLAVDGTAEDVGRGLSNDRHQVATSPRAVGDNAGAGGYGTDLPALANGHIDGRQPLEGAEALTTPDDRVEIGFEE